MAARTSGKVPYCIPCAVHNHVHCQGVAATTTASCECGSRAHNPTVEVAAAMRRYECPDQAVSGKFTVEQMASDWHRKDER